jgi:hypothetical protein
MTLLAIRGRRRPQKHEDVPALVREHVKAGRFLDTRHALDRRRERRINRPEVLYVLCHGYHEKRKDEFKEANGAWNYSIRGKTVDGCDLRVCVSFEDELGMLIITAIVLDA